MENIVVTKTSSEVTKCPTIGLLYAGPVMPATCPYRVVGHDIDRHMIPLYAQNTLNWLQLYLVLPLLLRTAHS